MASTQLQPTDARKVFPCFDEPSYKAKFQVTIVRAKGQISITNTPLIKSEPGKDGMVSDYYKRTVIMPTYLLAFVVCNFSYVQSFAGLRNTSVCTIVRVSDTRGNFMHFSIYIIFYIIFSLLSCLFRSYCFGK